MNLKKITWALALAGAVLFATACDEDKKEASTDTGNMTDMTDMTEGDTDPTDAPDPTDTDPTDTPDPTDTDPTDTPDPSDTTDATDTTEEDIVETDPLCTEYCDLAEANCNGANQLFATRAECLGACSQFEDGEASDMSGDSKYCRIYHLGDPAVAAPDFHCKHGSVTGAGVCSPPPASACDQFCGNVLETCPGSYASAEACGTACEGWEEGNLGDTSGPTLGCHNYYWTLATTNPIHCLPAGEGGFGICVDPDSEHQIDRAARPAINTALMLSSSTKEVYNKATNANAAVFVDEMTAALEFLDGLEGEPGDNLTGLPAAAVAGVLSNDVLLYQPALDDCVDGYLHLELAPDPKTKCGGRTLAQDVMDATVATTVGEAGASDSVDANDVAFRDAFPYLAPAN